VLDLTGVVSGPFATMFWRTRAPTCSRIEPIGGDITRRSRRPSTKAVSSPAVHLFNRGKRSLSIDVKSATGREGPRPAGRAGDVLVAEISAPAPWSGSASCRRVAATRNPRLIYVSISASAIADLT